MPLAWRVEDTEGAIGFGVQKGLLNAVVKPILKILGFPITVLTLGLFLLVINVIIVKLADFLMSSFNVHGLLNALLFSLALSVVNAVVDLVMD